MNVIMIKKNKILVILTVLVFAFTILRFSASFAMQHYYKTDFSTGLVTATTLNVRSGPSTVFGVVATVKKNEYIRIFAGIGEWYVIQTNDDHIGAVSKKYVKPIYPNTSSGGGNTGTPSGGRTTTATSTLTADEKEVFNLINQQRSSNGLASLKIDEELQRVARIKAQDMVNNNYFAHESPTYGTPFQMMSSFKISYKSAGENIAGNSSNTGAVNAWMNSSGHRANILNSSFNYTGIGVVSSPRYGKIYVQMFIGR